MQSGPAITPASTSAAPSIALLAQQMTSAFPSSGLIEGAMSTAFQRNSDAPPTLAKAQHA
jgi:hypothetical protein